MRVRLSLILSIVITLISLQVSACECVFFTLKHTIPFTDVIITGKFIHGEKLWELSHDNKDASELYYTGSFVVTKVLKGKAHKAGDTLRINSGFTNCSYLYINESDYLLFADSDHGSIKTTICSYSGMLTEEKTKQHLKQTKRILQKGLRTLHS